MFAEDMIRSTFDTLRKQFAVSAIEGAARMLCCDTVRKKTPFWPKRFSKAKRKALTAAFRLREDRRWRNAAFQKRLHAKMTMLYSAGFESMVYGNSGLLGAFATR